MNPRSPSDLHLPTKKPEPRRCVCACVVPSRRPSSFSGSTFRRQFGGPKLAVIRGSALAASLRQRWGGGPLCPVPFHLAESNPITLPQAAPDVVSGAGERRVAGGCGWDASFACPAPATLPDQARGEVAACFKHPSVICSGAP